MNYNLMLEDRRAQNTQDARQTRPFSSTLELAIHVELSPLVHLAPPPTHRFGIETIQKQFIN